MYIEPNSNITIYHNVPLDNTYNHTLYFSNLAEQNTYFHANQNIIKYNLTAQSYQRVVKGSIYHFKMLHLELNGFMLLSLVLNM